MKYIYVLIGLCFSICSSSQDSLDLSLQDTSVYQINTDSNIPELIIVGSEIRSYSMFEEMVDEFSYETLELDLDGDGYKELIFNWINSVYGSGGGMKTGGVQVWDLKGGVKLLDEINLCAEESFGRHGGEAYNIRCEIPFEFNDHSLLIGERVYNESWAASYHLSDLELNCTLTDMESGEYEWVPNEFKMKQD